VRRAIVTAFAIGLLAASGAGAKSPSSHSCHSGSHTTHSSGLSHHHATSKSHGKFERSQKAKDTFRKAHPCPSTGKSHGACPGYVIDHVQALKHGGADAPLNMQWQTAEAAKIKDRTE